MNFEALLRPQTCTCGMVHTCEIRQVVIAPGALAELPGLVRDYHHILLAADVNTYGVCGGRVECLLGEKLEGRVIFTSDGFLVPNEQAIAKLEAQLTEKTDLIVGIGSGVIQDLCKYVSFRAGLPYDIVATAPSMDGYASKGAAMIIGNMKVTYTAHVPEVIIGDVDVLKEAPMDMIRSGYGDILGKFSCLNDWKLGRLVNNEYFCQRVYDMTYEMLMKTKDLGPRLQARDPEAVQTLMEALVGIGVAMAYVGNSRPGSGSEHHLSHFFEVTGILNGETYFIHGTDVAYSAVYTQRLREELLQLKTPQRHAAPARSHWETRIREIYSGAAQGIIELQDRLGWYQVDRLPRYTEVWEEICRTLKEPPSSAEMVAYLESAGFDLEAFENLYGVLKIQDAIWYAKDLKDRYSVLWMYYDLMAEPFV